jgi:hypothetical protein
MKIGGLEALSGPVRTVRPSGTGAFWENAVGRPFWTMGCEPLLFRGRPCDLPGLCRERVVRHEASMIEWVERSNGGPSQRVVEAGGSLA